MAGGIYRADGAMLFVVVSFACCTQRVYLLRFRSQCSFSKLIVIRDLELDVALFACFCLLFFLLCSCYVDVFISSRYYYIFVGAGRRILIGSIITPDLPAKILDFRGLGSLPVQETDLEKVGAPFLFKILVLKIPESRVREKQYLEMTKTGS